MKYSIKLEYFYWALGRAFVVRVSILRFLWQSVARFTSFVWCDFLHCSFGCSSRRQNKLIMKEPRLCISNLSHGPVATWSQSSDPKNSIWAPQWLNRGLNSFCQTSFYYDSDKYRAPTSCSAYKSSFHDIFLYSYTDTVSVEAVTVVETCINICLATYSKCSSQYSCAFRESRRQCSRAVRVLEL